LIARPKGIAAGTTRFPIRWKQRTHLTVWQIITELTRAATPKEINSGGSGRGTKNETLYSSTHVPTPIPKTLRTRLLM
jgi:hypothetical protein